MKPRIIILTINPPERTGGVEQFVRELTSGLERRGYSVECIHWGNSVPSWALNMSGKFGRKLFGTLNGLFVGRKVQTRMKEDVVAVISNSDVGYYPVRAPNKDCRMVHVYHGTYRGQAESIRPFISYPGYLYLKWWASMVVERLSGHGKIVLCCSDPIREEVSKYFRLNGTTMWYPLDVNHFAPLDQAQCRQALALPVRSSIGLFVGNVSPMKNFPIVRMLMDTFPGVHWVLALRGEIPADIRDRDGLTIFHNANRDQLPQLYNAATFSVCPSRYDPFPYVVSESLACGTPVIAAPHGASRFFLDRPPLHDLLVSSPDAQSEFAAAVDKILQAPEDFRNHVISMVRPRLEAVMSPENWSSRFFEAIRV